MANARFKAKKASALANIGKAKKALQRAAIASMALHNFKELQAFRAAATSFPKQLKSDFQGLLGIMKEDRRMQELKRNFQMITVKNPEGLREARQARLEARQKELDAGKEDPGFDADDHKMHLTVTLDQDLKVFFHSLSSASGDELLLEGQKRA